MLRLGNTKAAASDSSEPLIRLQKNGMKFTLGAVNMLNLQEGDYVDVGQHEGSHWLTVTGREQEDGTKPLGKKVGKANTFSSQVILGALRGDASEEDKVAYRITNESLEMFETTWYKLELAEGPEVSERAEMTADSEPAELPEPEEEYNEEYEEADA